MPSARDRIIGGADVLHQRGIVALPDFVCNSGAVIGYRSAPEATPDQVLLDVEERIAGLITEALGHPGGPLAAACEHAARFLHGWWGDPPGPPFAAPGDPPAPHCLAAAREEPWMSPSPWSHIARRGCLTDKGHP